MDEYSDGQAIFAPLEQPTYGQSKVSSFAESVVRTFIGFWVGIAGNYAILPMYNIHPEFHINVQLTLWFTAISLVLSYCVRRMGESRWWKRMFRK
jgi:divalent metal cation (Fe/Co/Zn/Cd) transporter